jgi:anti-sigma B factor antagonist
MPSGGENPDTFDAEVIRGAGEIVVLVRGDIDIVSAPVLWDRLVEVIPDTKRLVLDLKDTEFIDSTGLSIFVRGLRRMRSGGGDLVLRSPRPKARQILKLTGLDQVLTIE